MASPDEFAAECAQAAKNLRRIPKDLRRNIAGEVKEKVAVPLAARIGSAASGPYAGPLNAATKARASADPQIVVGGAKRVVSGGASARQLVYGTEFGGGKKVKSVRGTGKRRSYKRRTTNQFVPAHPFIYPTLGRSTGWALEQFAGIVLSVLDREV